MASANPFDPQASVAANNIFGPNKAPAQPVGSSPTAVSSLGSLSQTSTLPEFHIPTNLWGPVLSGTETSPQFGSAPQTSPAAPPAAPPATPGLLSGPGPGEQWAADHQNEFQNPGAAENLYATHGQDLINTPSASENLYSQGIGQLDPYYDYATKRAAQSINDASAARGNWNSSATLYGLGDSAANLRGQQAAQMGARASAADSAKVSRYGAGFDEANASDAGHNSRIGAAENLYGGWQQQEENRLGGALSTSTTLSKDQSDAIAAAYKNAGDLNNTDNLEAFNAQLQKLGIDPASAAAKDAIAAAKAAGELAIAGSK